MNEYLTKLKAEILNEDTLPKVRKFENFEIYKHGTLKIWKFKNLGIWNFEDLKIQKVTSLKYRVSD